MAISKRLRFEILRRDGNTCRYCGSGGTPTNPLVVDHVMPVTLGGADHPSNLVASCRACNAGKTSSLTAHATVADLPGDALASALKMCSLAWRQIQQLESEQAETRSSAPAQFVTSLLDEHSEEWDIHQLVQMYDLEVDARIVDDAQYLVAAFRSLFSTLMSEHDALKHALNDMLVLLPTAVWHAAVAEADDNQRAELRDSWAAYLCDAARGARVRMQRDPGLLAGTAAGHLESIAAESPF